MLQIEDKEYHGQVLAKAKEMGGDWLERLSERLNYLGNYSCHDGDTERTRCRLFSDFAPLSYYFIMELRVEVRDRECLSCGHKFTAKVVREKPTPNISGEATVWCERCGAKTCGEPIRQEYQEWFNGGLIFHGPHDNGGDGGAPTFSVNLMPSHGWNIHT